MARRIPRVVVWLNINFINHFNVFFFYTTICSLCSTMANQTTGNNYNRKFFDGTSIHAVHFVFGLQRKYRKSWGALCLVSLACLLWLAINNIRLYQKHDIATNWVYQNSSEIDFPAISICNENVVKRSFVGPIPVALDAMSSFFVERASDSRMQYEVLYKILTACKTPYLLLYVLFRTTNRATLRRTFIVF